MTYEQALEEYTSIGASRAGDVPLLAGYCRHVLQSVVGAVSPRLVFEGAVSKGITSSDLARLSISDPIAVSDLQWV